MEKKLSKKALIKSFHNWYYGHLTCFSQEHMQTFGYLCAMLPLVEELYKNEDDNPTIGIILCSQKNEAIVKYSVLNDAQQVFASRYRLTLPSAEELQHEIEAERKRIEEQEE